MASSPLRRCTHECRLFFIALQFFTRLPIPRWVGFEAQWLQHASRYFPAVGLVVAAIASAVYTVAAWFWPAPVAALLSSAAGIYATGAFHEDGFADVCDGFGGGMTPERVLDIMKDSRIGAYGAIGIALLIALKCMTLAAMPTASACAALFFAHPVSRLAATALIWRLDYARAEGKAKPMAQQISNGEFAIATFGALAAPVLLGLGGYLPWWKIGTGVLVAALTALWLAHKFVRRIGGYTGDCLGAVQQLAEVAIYLCVLGRCA